MKAKLIKIKDGYELFTQGFLKGSTNHELIDSLNVEEGNIRYKLSLKNCQTIERGYDLDWIKRKVFDGFDGQPDSFTITAVERTIQIMFELMSDKKFSGEDIREAYSRGQTNSPIQSLQQTEWDVTFNPDELDADGCLILKTFKSE